MAIHQHSSHVEISRWFHGRSRIPTFDLTWQVEVEDFEDGQDEGGALEVEESFGSLDDAVSRARHLLFAADSPCSECDR